MDGASTLQTFRLVVLPISLPALFAAGVFAFIEAWNEFFFAIILTRVDIKTAPIAIAEFSGQYQTLYGQMLAAAVLASIPVVLLAIVFRQLHRQGVRGGGGEGLMADVELRADRRSASGRWRPARTWTCTSRMASS